jgi:hypothetical protein
MVGEPQRALLHFRHVWFQLHEAEPDLDHRELAMFTGYALPRAAFP